MDLRDLGAKDPAYNTDIARLRRGLVGGQFWSVWVSPDLPGKEQVKQTLEQIDLVRSLTDRYPDTFALARTAADVRRAHAAGRIACLIGVEGGGQIDGSLSVLRAYAALGAGYLTLTHSRTIDWADSATDDPRHGGLTDFGRKVVLELNRLGMLVDLSHVSERVMRDALAVTRAPVIFSHSGARALNDHPRNVSDDVLRLVARNGGVVMVDYAPGYVADAYRRPRTLQVARLMGGLNEIPGRVVGDRHVSALGRFPVRPTAVEGDAVLLVRQEDLVLADPDAPVPATASRIEAMVTDVRRAGARTDVTVRTPDGTVLHAEAPGTSPPSPGDAIGLDLPHAARHVVAG